MSTGSVSIDQRRHLRQADQKGRGMLKNLILKWADAIHRRETESVGLVGIDREPQINKIGRAHV